MKRQDIYEEIRIRRNTCRDKNHPDCDFLRLIQSTLIIDEYKIKRYGRLLNQYRRKVGRIELLD